MARQFVKIPLPIKRFRLVIDAIEDDGDECERLAGLVTVAQSLCEEETSKPLTLTIPDDAQPCENRNR